MPLPTKLDFPTTNHITHFLRTDYQKYAVYRVHQRLPHIIDGLGQTQRKIIHVLEETSSSKKLKTAEIYSLIYSRTKYLHGDASAYNTSETLSRSASNNINILTEEGNFGFRTNKAAAGPRYTNTRLSPTARSIFKKEDQNILRIQEFEGSPIEPEFLLPVIPPVVFNGIEAIAVGYSCNIQPRDPVQVIQSCLNILNNQEPQEPLLKYPYYTGPITRIIHQGKESWLLAGTLTRISKSKVKITEVPPNYTREIYIKKLKKLKDQGIIRGFTEDCVKNDFTFVVSLPKEVSDLSDSDILIKLQLQSKITENLTFINPVKNLDIVDTTYRFDKITDYLKVFIEVRKKFYQIRKDSQIDLISKEIEVINAKIQFIKEVNSKDIIITNRKKKELELDLKSKDYLKINNSYDYLLGMKLWNLTDEVLRSYEKTIREKKIILIKIQKTTTKEMHIKELQELLDIIGPEVLKK